MCIRDSSYIIKYYADLRQDVKSSLKITISHKTEMQANQPIKRKRKGLQNTFTLVPGIGCGSPQASRLLFIHPAMPTYIMNYMISRKRSAPKRTTFSKMSSDSTAQGSSSVKDPFLPINLRSVHVLRPFDNPFTKHVFT